MHCLMLFQAILVMIMQLVTAKNSVVTLPNGNGAVKGVVEDRWRTYKGSCHTTPLYSLRSNCRHTIRGTTAQRPALPTSGTKAALGTQGAGRH